MIDKAHSIRRSKVQIVYKSGAFLADFINRFPPHFGLITAKETYNLIYTVIKFQL